MDWLNRILGHKNDQRPISIRIYVRDDGFDLVIQIEVPVTVKVDWVDIKRIEAHRSDSEGYPSVSLRFTRFWGRPPITLDRGDIGFKDIPPALAKAFPQIPDDWEAIIEAPFGYLIHQVLYDAD